MNTTDIDVTDQQIDAMVKHIKGKLRNAMTNLGYRPTPGGEVSGYWNDLKALAEMREARTGTAKPAVVAPAIAPEPKRKPVKDEDAGVRRLGGARV